MLQAHLKQFCEEFRLVFPKKKAEKTYLLKFAKETVGMKDLDPGLSMYAHICKTPKEKREDLFIYLMRANLLGQGTGLTRIGMSPDENFLTLSLGLPYELNYIAFKEAIEDFINYLIYWREEVKKFEEEPR